MPKNIKYTDNQAVDAVGNQIKNATGNVLVTYNEVNNSFNLSAPVGETIQSLALSGSTLQLVTSAGSQSVDLASLRGDTLVSTTLDGTLLRITSDKGEVSVDLASLTSTAVSYDDTALKNRVSAVETSVAGKVDKDGSKVLTDVNFAQADKTKLDLLTSYSAGDNITITNGVIASVASGSSVTVEQDLTSNSTSSVPSIKAVKDALDALPVPVSTPAGYRATYEIRDEYIPEIDNNIYVIVAQDGTQERIYQVGNEFEIPATYAGCYFNMNTNGYYQFRLLYAPDSLATYFNCILVCTVNGHTLLPRNGVRLIDHDGTYITESTYVPSDMLSSGQEVVDMIIDHSNRNILISHKAGYNTNLNIIGAIPLESNLSSNNDRLIPSVKAVKQAIDAINTTPTGSSITVEQNLTSNSTSSVPSIKAVKDALDATGSSLVYNSIANTITSSFVRTYFDTAQLAINAAGAGSTVNVYSTKFDTPLSPGGTFTGLSFPALPMTINLYGLTMNTPDANTDILVFRGGFKTIVNAHNSTVVSGRSFVGDPTGIGWTVWGRGNPGMDLTINNLNIILTTINSLGFILSSAGVYNYTGNITLEPSPVSSTVLRERSAIKLVSPGVLNFYGNGNITAYGFAPELGVSKNPTLLNYVFDIAPGNRMVWEGNINVFDDVLIKMGVAAKLELNNGVLNAKARVAAYPLFGTTAGTVILNNYSVLCSLGEDAIRAETVILRGNSVVVGNIIATNIIDERPVVASTYLLPVATAQQLGGVKEGAGISIAADGTISATGGGDTGTGYDDTSLKARVSTVETGLTNKVDKDGNKVLTDVNFAQADKSKLDGLTNYTAGSNITITNGVIASTSTSTAGTSYDDTALKNRVSAVESGKLSNGVGAVANSNLANGSVTADKINSYTINFTHIADESLSNGNMSTGMVDERLLGEQVVSNDKLRDGAVSTAKLQDGAVTYAKLSDDVKNRFNATPTAPVKYFTYNNLPTAYNAPSPTAAGGFPIWIGAANQGSGQYTSSASAGFVDYGNGYPYVIIPVTGHYQITIRFKYTDGADSTTFSRPGVKFGYGMVKGRFNSLPIPISQADKDGFAYYYTTQYPQDTCHTFVKYYVAGDFVTPVVDAPQWSSHFDYTVSIISL